MQKKSSTAALLIATSCIIWGIQPVFVKYLVKEMNPITVVSFRYVVVSATLFLIMGLRGQIKVPSRDIWLPLIAMGILGTCINNVTQFIGLQYSSVSHSTVISAITPVITALLSYILIKERLHILQCIGIFFSLSGVLYLISQGSLQTIINMDFNPGDILFVVSQTAWALYSIILVRIIDRISALEIVAWSGIVGSIMTGLFGVVTGNFIIPSSLSPLAWLSYMIIIFGGGLLALLFWNKGADVIGPSQASVFMNLMPLAGILSGIIFLGEEFHVSTAIGGSFILGGVYLTTQYKKIIGQLSKLLVK